MFLSCLPYRVTDLSDYQTIYSLIQNSTHYIGATKIISGNQLKIQARI